MFAKRFRIVSCGEDAQGFEEVVNQPTTTTVTTENGKYKKRPRR